MDFETHLKWNTSEGSRNPNSEISSPNCVCFRKIMDALAIWGTENDYWKCGHTIMVQIISKATYILLIEGNKYCTKTWTFNRRIRIN